jgi:hypothetical protein
MIHTSEDYWRGALTAIANGWALRPLFNYSGIKCINHLLGFAPTFGAGVVEANDILTLHEALKKANTEGQIAQPAWPEDIDKASKYLRSIILHARNLAPVEAASKFQQQQPQQQQQDQQQLEKDAPSAPSQKEQEKALIQMAKTQYKVAEKAFPSLDTKAAKRINYKLVGTLTKGYRAGEPVAYSLQEYTKELRVSQPHEESYEFLGKTFTNLEGAPAKVKIATFEDMIGAMEDRAHAVSVAGAWDIATNAEENEKDPPEPQQRCEKSKIEYIDGGEVKSMNAFATHAVQMLRVEAMKKFHKLHPHVSVVGGLLETIDAHIEEQLADMILEGYTADAAITQLVVKDTENHSINRIGSSSTATASTSESGTAAQTSGDDSKKRKGRSDERSAEDKLVAAQRNIEQKEKQIANLKGHGKSVERGGTPRGGYGHRFDSRNDHYNYSGGGHYSNNDRSYGYSYGGKGSGGKGGGGPPGPRAAPDVCKDFNFKGRGCTEASCRFKHICAACGDRGHGWQTCPRNR